MRSLPVREGGDTPAPAAPGAGRPLTFFLPALKPYTGRLGGLALLMLLSTFLEGAGIGLFFPLIEYIQQGPEVITRGASRPLFETAARWGLEPSVGGLIAVIFLIVLATLALKFAVFTLSAEVYNPLMKGLRDEAFSKILHSHLFHFYSSTSAALNQTLEDELEHVGQSLNFAVLLAASLFSLAVYAVMILWVSWKLTLLVAVIAAARYGVSSLCIRRVRRLGEEFGGLRVEHKSRLNAVYAGIDVVKSFASEEREESFYRGLTARIRANAQAMAKTAAANGFFEGILGDALLCVIVYLAVSRLSVSGTTLLTFLFIITRIIPKVTAVNDARIRIAEYLSRVKLLPAALSNEGLPALRWGTRRLESFQKSLVLERVSFSYPGVEIPSLQDVSLTLNHNETLAVVGASGAGKSTLAKLILRLFDPSSGRVLADGIPLDELKREDWTHLVGVVSQDTFIFDDTLEVNVKYGAPAASEESYRQALKRARASEFVAALPDKDQTRLGERGVKLSGGQRQRIAIARAFLRNPPLLILDEATSALDAATEKLISEAISDLSQERTMVIIAHRFTTIRGAGRIAVLESGRLAESGTHEELKANGSRYRRYLELQTP